LNKSAEQYAFEKHMAPPIKHESDKNISKLTLEVRKMNSEEDILEKEGGSKVVKNGDPRKSVEFDPGELQRHPEGEKTTVRKGKTLIGFQPVGLQGKFESSTRTNKSQKDLSYGDQA